MRCSTWRWRGTLLLTTGIVVGCGSDTIVDDWPTYEVSGIVRRANGTPVAQGFVELHVYNELQCGTTLWAYSSGLTDVAGRYRVQQDELAGVLTGCLRVTAHEGSDPLSEPTVSIDTVVQNLAVAEGETSITVDLTLPD